MKKINSILKEVSKSIEPKAKEVRKINQLKKKLRPIKFLLKVKSLEFRELKT